MLNHLLAGIVALGSLVLFLSGFFFPEVQRKPDLAWSGVALLYALLLFAEGDRTSGGAVLGHMASVALILWFGWQTLQQRRQFATVKEQTTIPDSMEALTPFVKEGWGRIVIAYGEASSWVQDRLDKDDTSIAPETLTQQSQDWDDPSTDSESDDVVSTVTPKPDDAVVALEPEPTLEPSATPIVVKLEPTLEPTISSEDTPNLMVAAEPESSYLESPASSTMEETFESPTILGEPEQPRDEADAPVVSDEASEVEMENAAIAPQQTSAPAPESIPSPSELEPPASETEATVSMAESENFTLHKTSVASTHTEEDGTWPPHPIDE